MIYIIFVCLFVLFLVFGYKFVYFFYKMICYVWFCFKEKVFYLYRYGVGIELYYKKLW